VNFSSEYDVIVIGAGHAGCEAALASARLQCQTLMITLNLDNIAMMPCNPSVGGPAKGHLVREIDALGGEMGINADKASLQTRMLNTGKGPAVYALRSQADKRQYQRYMIQTVETQSNLDVRQLMVDQVLFNEKKVTGIVTETGEMIGCKALVIATGTYLMAKIVLGTVSYSGGPSGIRSADCLSQSLVDAGVRLMRFKTGTPPRIDRRSVDFSKIRVQPGDPELHRFSFMSLSDLTREQVPCWLTYTNERTHQIIRDNLYRAPLYTGSIQGTGPRYCPSIEVKIVNFPDKPSHQVFLEPESIGMEEMYVQGMSTSLPADVQLDMLRSIDGLQNVRIMRYGYAIEYDCIDPSQLANSLGFKDYWGLFSAGQANGSSGYEEAAAQGLIAGINAALTSKGKDPFILSRAEAYIGVLIDDLVTKGVNEPYRITTSRAEYRLLLRQDNADLRLTEFAFNLGLATEERYNSLCKKKLSIAELENCLRSSILSPSDGTQNLLLQMGTTPIRNSLSAFELLRRPEVRFDQLRSIIDIPEYEPDVIEQVQINAKYEGYITRQQEQVERMKKLEGRKISENLVVSSIKGLSTEGRQKLESIRPTSLGQAARISGVSPADIAVLMVYLENMRRKGQ